MGAAAVVVGAVETAAPEAAFVASTFEFLLEESRDGIIVVFEWLVVVVL